MAQLTLNIPDDKVAALAAAIEAGFGREEGEANVAMAKRFLLDKLKRVYKWHKGQLAKSAAETDAGDDIIIT